MTTFICDKCGFSKVAPDEWLNRRAICPKCKQKSVIAPDDVVLSDPASFDEKQTFAYKGDFLGMSLSDFMDRHDETNGDEFQLVSSKDVPLSDYKIHGFEDWMHNCERLVEYCATGSRLTIVGFPLKLGVFTFLDNTLSSISLLLLSPTEDTYIDLLPELYLALSDDTEDSGLEDIHITTWVRPLGNLNLVYITYEPSIQVRYVNLETLETFNAIRAKHTGSIDL